MISQKVMDGFGRNLVDMLGVRRGRIDLLLVRIQIQIRNLMTCVTLRFENAWATGMGISVTMD